MQTYELRFCETNAGYLVWAIANDNRACFMWQNGHEKDYPTDHKGWSEAAKDERRRIALKYLERIAEAFEFEDLYADCKNDRSGFCGISTSDEFWRDIKSGGTTTIAFKVEWRTSCLKTSNWRQCCKEVWRDDDGWWATLKEGYYCGTDDNTVINGETYRQLVEAAKEIHQ